MYVTLLAAHQFNVSLILLNDGFPAVAEWVQVLQMYVAASWSQFIAMDARREARLAWDIAWTFACRTLQIEKSSRFKYCENGGQSTRVKNSAKNCRVVLVAWVGVESSGRRIFQKDMSTGPSGSHAVSKALGRRVGINSFVVGNQQLAA